MFHGRWYGEAEKLASSVNIEPGKPRTAQKQLNRANTPAESISEYYERVVTLPFIDHLTSEMQNPLEKQGNSEWILCSPGKSCVATRMETTIYTIFAYIPGRPPRVMLHQYRIAYVGRLLQINQRCSPCRPLFSLANDRQNNISQ